MKVHKGIKELLPGFYYNCKNKESRSIGLMGIDDLKHVNWNIYAVTFSSFSDISTLEYKSDWKDYTN